MTNLGFDPKIVLVTGAGASVPLGMPTAAGFLDVLRRNKSIDQQYLEEAILASERLVASTQIERVDVESLLDHITSFSSGAPSVLAETQFAIPATEHQRINERVAQYTKLREQILESIVETFGEVDLEKVVPLLHALTLGLAKCFDASVLPVFTLNYDLAFETYIDQVQPRVEMIDGFDRAPSALIRRWSKDIFARSLANPPPTGTELRVLLFKLHGSANWGRDLRTRELHQIGFLPRDPGRYETVLYYPSLNQKPTYQEPFQTAFDYFLQALTRAETVMIIGTSFRDKSVTDILLRVKPKCHVIVCNRSSDAPEFVSHLKGKGVYVTYIAGDIGLPSTRYALVWAALGRSPGAQTYSWRRSHRIPLPIIDSLPHAGLYRAGSSAAAVLEGDIIAGPSPHWYLVSNGMLCHIPDIPTFNALGFVKGSLMGATEDALTLPMGDPLQSLASDCAIIRKPNTDDIFIVLDGKLCHIADVPTLEAFRGNELKYGGSYGIIQAMRNFSEDTFNTLPYGDQVTLKSFDHRDPTGESTKTTDAYRSILTLLASNADSSLYRIKEQLGFQDERVFRALMLHLLRFGAIIGNSPDYPRPVENLALVPVDRISYIPYTLNITNEGLRLLQQEIDSSLIPTALPNYRSS